jgi:hypothetical protein
MDNGNVSRAVDILDAASQGLSPTSDRAQGRCRRIRARRPRQRSAGPLQDHPHAGRISGRLRRRSRRSPRRQRQKSGRALAASGPRPLPRDPAILSLAARTSRPAATTSAPPTTIAPRSPPCPRSRPSIASLTCSFIPSRITRPHRAVTAADLQRLLDPDDEPFAKTTKLPPLPAYGPDPYEGPRPSCCRRRSRPSQAPSHRQHAA